MAKRGQNFIRKIEQAVEKSKAVNMSPDSQPAKESISYNEELLPWLGASGRSNYVRSFLLIMTVLIVLIVCGSALLIYNAFAISIGKRKKQFGMFASVGATSAQIRRNPICLSLGKRHEDRVNCQRRKSIR